MRINIEMLVKLIVGSILVLLLTSCGGVDTETRGGSGFNTFTISVNGGPTRDLSDAQVLLGSYYNEVQMTASSAYTLIWASTSEGYGVMLTFDGSGIGGYGVEEGNVTIFYRDENDNIFEATSAIADEISSVEGVVTVVEYSDVGGFITGTYNITASVYANGLPSSTTATLRGYFSVVRFQDDYSTIDVY